VRTFSCLYELSHSKCPLSPDEISTFSRTRYPRVSFNRRKVDYEPLNIVKKSVAPWMHHSKGLKVQRGKMDGSALCTPDSVTIKVAAGNLTQRSTISSHLTFSGSRLTADTASPCLSNDAPSYRVHTAAFPFMLSDYGGRTTGVRIWVTAASTWIHVFFVENSIKCFSITNRNELNELT